MTLDTKINRVHTLILGNISAKFDPYTLKCLISIGSQVYCDLDLSFLTFKINRVHPFIMVYMSAEFDEDAHNGLVYCVNKVQV